MWPCACTETKSLLLHSSSVPSMCSSLEVIMLFVTCCCEAIVSQTQEHEFRRKKIPQKPKQNNQQKQINSWTRKIPFFTLMSLVNGHPKWIGSGLWLGKEYIFNYETCRGLPRGPEFLCVSNPEILIPVHSWPCVTGLASAELTIYFILARIPSTEIIDWP